MLPFALYIAFLAAACGFAFLYGDRDHRLVAAACVGGTLATALVLNPVDQRYGGIEYGVLAVDLFILIIFCVIALRSDRFWPLWVAGLQLTTSFAHAMKAMNADLLPYAYGAAARFWVYPILLILIIGTWRGWQRRLRAEKNTQQARAA
ncbi:hypothetical protein [Sphingomicrobium sediminis]|uniref:Uncharacterized protein n=1 Tax=Sphingomicrobium sediminis TaxID=2950949 RepID=A0A9X2EIZ1_9SPHN|nr:hypothetical protein [Sphingomicrobium sediminis]MCM8557656.1 hypothetical protein [Sphingomicrobium sediminis]